MKGCITQWGNSQGIRIPKAILESASFRENQSFRFIARDGEIVLKKERGHIKLADRFKSYQGTYQPQEFEWGGPVGKEV